MRKTTTNSCNGTAISTKYENGRLVIGVQPESGDNVEFEFVHCGQLRHFIACLVNGHNEMHRAIMEHIAKTVHVAKDGFPEEGSTDAQDYN
jgi:hypothetical protein